MINGIDYTLVLGVLFLISLFPAVVGLLAPRGGIEPPTQGFSVHDSINKNLNNELFLRFDKIISS